MNCSFAPDSPTARLLCVLESCHNSCTTPCNNQALLDLDLRCQPSPETNLLSSSPAPALPLSPSFPLLSLFFFFFSLGIPCSVPLTQLPKAIFLDPPLLYSFISQDGAVLCLKARAPPAPAPAPEESSNNEQGRRLLPQQTHRQLRAPPAPKPRPPLRRQQKRCTVPCAFPRPPEEPGRVPGDLTPSRTLGRGRGHRSAATPGPARPRVSALREEPHTRCRGPGGGRSPPLQPGTAPLTAPRRHDTTPPLPPPSWGSRDLRATGTIEQSGQSASLRP